MAVSLPPRLRLWLATLGGCLIATAFAGAFSFDSPLVADVRPHLGRAPQDIIVSARVWPSDDNKYLTVTIVSDDGDDHTTVKELHGASEPVQHRMVYAGVAAGEYVVETCLLRADKMFCQTSPVLVAP